MTVWMNEYEIDDAVRRYEGHPALGPAARTLRNLRDEVNRNSDGWPYWKKPARAAQQLMTLVVGDPRDRFNDRDDVTAAQVRKTYTPIKAFLTRNGLTIELEDPV